MPGLPHRFRGKFGIATKAPNVVEVETPGAPVLFNAAVTGQQVVKAWEGPQ
ncbi:hypothetical protein [Streptomyces sp. NBC_00151]|uniref:hypothetical protein n=1 Tax=Streptomyces sp. NBC_00151 TaxID=2975669 RepID=UPI002DD97965|nr:hypothetical protein [Streptomyces sp. NBC_00151]WRZ44566.1 hypothetical protein OG915_45160 [Streptomyces sp. NBC_00151]